MCVGVNKRTLKQTMHTYVCALLISTQIISFISFNYFVRQLSSLTAFYKRTFRKENERKLFQSVSKVYNSFSQVCRNRFIRNYFSLRKQFKSWFLKNIGELTP